MVSGSWMQIIRVMDEVRDGVESSGKMSSGYSDCGLQSIFLQKILPQWLGYSVL